MRWQREKEEKKKKENVCLQLDELTPGGRAKKTGSA